MFLSEQILPPSGSGRQNDDRQSSSAVEFKGLSMSAFFLAVAILLEITGTTALKLSAGFTRLGPASIVVVRYLSSFVVLSWALRGIALSAAYAVWSGVGTALVAAIGILWFGELAGAWKLLSIGLIIAGVAGLHLAGSRP
jgi:small multidrug resistance pump